jgi:hypothetical protein
MLKTVWQIQIKTTQTNKQSKAKNRKQKNPAKYERKRHMNYKSTVIFIVIDG